MTTFQEPSCEDRGIVMNTYSRQKFSQTFNCILNKYSKPKHLNNVMHRYS